MNSRFLGRTPILGCIEYQYHRVRGWVYCKGEREINCLACVSGTAVLWRGAQPAAIVAFISRSFRDIALDLAC